MAVDGSNAESREVLGFEMVEGILGPGMLITEGLFILAFGFISASLLGPGKVCSICFVSWEVCDEVFKSEFKSLPLLPALG